MGPGLTGEEPDPRFSLANERTFLAWIRTSIALIAGGLASSQLLQGLPGARWVLAVPLALLGLVVAATAHGHYLHIQMPCAMTSRCRAHRCRSSWVSASP